ncbi:MAG: S8 family serine peptidase [Planctomycetota bacterium]
MTRRDHTCSSIRRGARGALSAALIVTICGAASAQIQEGRDAIENEAERIQLERIFTIGQDEEVRADRLYLAAGRVDTSARTDAQSLSDAIAQADPDERMVIQLDGPMTEERRALLEDAGLSTLGYLPTNAFIVRPANGDANKAALLDFVVWHAPYQSEWKLSPELGAREFATQERRDLLQAGRVVVNVHAFMDADANNTLELINASLNGPFLFQTERFDDSTIYTFEIDLADADTLAAMPEIQYIEDAPEVTYRSNATTRWVAQSNALNQTPIYDQGLFGEGQIVGVLDSPVDANHCSFSDTVPFGPSHRKIIAYNTSQSSFFHGTHVAGTVVGDAGNASDTRGHAYLGRMVFNTEPSFTDAGFYNTAQTHHNQGARVHTNSWGNDGTTQYEGLARGIDRFSYDNEESLVLFACTNGSVLRNPENAKNVLAVGGTNSAPSQDTHCTGGIGPTSDGRRKPEIYLPGCGILSSLNNSSCSTGSASGTSMATPAVSGSAMLTREYFQRGFYPTGIETATNAFTPSGALLKATLINSTVDMTGVSGFPSNLEGWGRLLLDNALFFDGDTRGLYVEDVRNADGLTTGGSASYSVNVTSSSEPLNITAVWTEPPATAGASFASINNLDLLVTAPDGSQYRGNVFAGGQSATGGVFDSRNNVESVRVASPAVGPWTIEVLGTAINQGTQGFAIATNGAVVQGPVPLVATLDTVLPDTLPRLQSFGVTMTIAPGDDTLVPGSVKALVSDDGENFDTVPLTEGAPGVFSGTIGPFECETTPVVILEAEGATSGLRYASGASPSNPHTIEIGEVAVLAEDDFETDTGWFVSSNADTGAWERAVPQPTAAQPGADTSPSGTVCFVTGAASGGALGANDIDEGSTTLTSPLFDLSGLDSATVFYNRWYSNSTGGSPNQDTFVIEVTNNNGSTWTVLETVGPAGAGTSGGWIPVELNVEDFVSLTANVRFRFTASDLGGGSIVEAAIDDFRIEEFACEGAVNVCSGDFTNDGIVDLGDFGIFGAAFGSTPADGNWDPRADFNNNGEVDLGDFGNFGAEFGRTDCVQ